MLKRAKGPLFTPYEKQVLTEKADRHMEILDNKCNNSKTIFLKQQTWNLITQEFNSTPGVTPRSKKQLKNLWKNMKCRAKFQSLATMRFLTTDYGDLSTGSVMPRLQNVPDIDCNNSNLPVNIIIKEEPNDNESEESAPRSTEQQSRDEMSISDDSDSPIRSRSPEARENDVAVSVSAASSLTQHQTLQNKQELADPLKNARIPTYKAIQPKYPFTNSAFNQHFRPSCSNISLNPPLHVSTVSSESPAKTICHPHADISQVKRNHSGESPLLKNKRIEPAWTLNSSQHNEKILEMAETEHKRKMEIMEKEHQRKLELMEKEHQRKLELFSLKEEVLLLKKQKMLKTLSAKNESNNISTNNDMQPF